MKVIYVAKHNSGGNDDEGAIAYAIEALGHRVVRVDERAAKNLKSYSISSGADLLLFHKWDNAEMLHRYEGVCPRAFWYFDLVNWPSDPTLNTRCATRMDWMRRITPNVDFGFCTDGDWVRDNEHKLSWLPQGADERVVGAAAPIQPEPEEILFTGITRGAGRERLKFVEEVAKRFVNQFRQVPYGLHREKLRSVIASTKIVLCPSAPVTDRYWSNRVYNAAGFGAFILHPYSFNMLSQYSANKEVVYYHTMNDLFDSIAFYQEQPEKRERIQAAALERTIKDHLYRHRLTVLLDTIFMRESNAGRSTVAS